MDAVVDWIDDGDLDWTIVRNVLTDVNLTDTRRIHSDCHRCVRGILGTNRETQVLLFKFL